MKKINILLIFLLMFAGAQAVLAAPGESRKALAMHADASGTSSRSESIKTQETIREKKRGLAGLFASSSENQSEDAAILASSAASPAQASKVFVPEMKFTFRDVYEGESVVHDFVIRNKGNAPLDIINVNPG